MSRLTRYAQQIFGSTAIGSRIAIFGSLAAGSPVAYSGATITPDLVQSQSGQFNQGLDGAVIATGGSPPASPALQDHNALFYLYSYQLAYLFQQGIPEYNGSTTYYSNSILKAGGSMYVTIYGSAAGVVGQLPPNATYYQLLYGISPYNPGTSSQILSFTAGSAGFPQPVTQISASNLPTANYHISTSSGNFSTTSGSFVDVTNLAGSITTSGRPVQVFLQPDGNGSNPSFFIGAPGTLMTVRIINTTTGSTYDTYVRGSVNTVFPLAFGILDTPAAGTYSYKAQVMNVTPGSTSQVGYATLVVRET